MIKFMERFLRLSESVQRRLEQPINIDEVEQVIRDLPGGNPPGVME